MSIDVSVPAVGESISEGILARWLVAEGEHVDEDQPLFELETDKISTEVPSPGSGAITLKAAEGDTVSVEQVVAAIDTSAKPPSDDGQDTKRTVEPAPDPEPAAKSETTTINKPPESALIPPLSPAVKQLVSDHQLDPTKIKGSGPDGRLTKGDVLAHVEQKDSAPQSSSDSKASQQGTSKAPPAAPAAGEESRRRMSPLRQRIAQRLVQAQRTAAMLTTFNEVDMSACMALRKQHKEAFQEKHGVGLGFMSFFVKAVVAALRDNPDINSRIDGEEVVTPSDINIGVAVGTEKGLVVPVLRRAQDLNFAEIEGGIRAFAKRARDGKLAIQDMEGGTFTITNGGVYGSLMSTPILNPPQSGILGMHTIKERPVAVDGQVVIRPMMYTALSYDHRLVDGAGAVGFLVKIKELIESPERIMFDL